MDGPCLATRSDTAVDSTSCARLVSLANLREASRGCASMYPRGDVVACWCWQVQMKAVRGNTQQQRATATATATRDLRQSCGIGAVRLACGRTTASTNGGSARHSPCVRQEHGQKPHTTTPPNNRSKHPQTQQTQTNTAAGTGVRPPPHRVQLVQLKLVPQLLVTAERVPVVQLWDIRAKPQTGGRDAERLPAALFSLKPPQRGGAQALFLTHTRTLAERRL